MRIDIGGTRLYFDCESPQWKTCDAALHRKPTLLMLHGGPGIDHSLFRETGRALAEVAHVVYLDHRGNGRSDRGSTPEWTLARWADDVRAFCDALELEKPIVLGSSFGGYVAQAYAAAHPGHAGGLVLVGTAPRFMRDRSVAQFRRIGGERIAELARSYFESPAEGFSAYLETCYPYYAKAPGDPAEVRRMVLNLEVAHHFVGGEMASFDLRAGLASVAAARTPTLVLSGGDDVIATPDDIAELLTALDGAPVTHARFPTSRHKVLADGGEDALAAIRRFIATVPTT